MRRMSQRATAVACDFTIEWENSQDAISANHSLHPLSHSPSQTPLPFVTQPTSSPRMILIASSNPSSTENGRWVSSSALSTIMIDKSSDMAQNQIPISCRPMDNPFTKSARSQRRSPPRCWPMRLSGEMKLDDPVQEYLPDTVKMPTGRGAARPSRCFI